VPDYKSVKEYTLAMNVAVMVNQHDGGQTWTLSRLSDGARLRLSFDWGDEDRHYADITRWLDTLPWPGEDDPRVNMQGTYEDRRVS
jgi:hypothetical protein